MEISKIQDLKDMLIDGKKIYIDSISKNLVVDSVRDNWGDVLVIDIDYWGTKKTIKVLEALFQIEIKMVDHPPLTSEEYQLLQFLNNNRADMILMRNATNCDIFSRWNLNSKGEYTYLTGISLTDQLFPWFELEKEYKLSDLLKLAVKI